MLSIRMRASKVKGQNLTAGTRSAKLDEIHISGAEGIFYDKEGSRMVGEYARRAMNHPRGTPDIIVITIEKLKEAPVMIRTMPVTTLKSNSLSEARESIKKILAESGISLNAVRNAFKVVYGTTAMRGASLICAGSGRRVEPDKKRGVRATCLGISRAAKGALADLLEKHGLNNTTVKEALVLASKVAACSSVLAELCVSDDPHYTTGYVSSRKYGYVRIPRIKKKGGKEGGRVFFIDDDADVGLVVGFLEETPVLVNGISECRGTSGIDEIIDRDNL